MNFMESLTELSHCLYDMGLEHEMIEMGREEY
jgi:hypothetical protein